MYITGLATDAPCCVWGAFIHVLYITSYISFAYFFLSNDFTQK